MINRLMITAATAALIAGTGLANAQGMGGGREGGAAGGAATQQSAPSSPSASPSSGAADHEGSPGMKKSGQSEQRGGAANRSAQQEKSGSIGAGEKSAQTGEKSSAQERSAQDTKQDTKGDHSKSMNSQNEKGAAGKDMKAEGREERSGSTKAEGRDNNNTAAGAKEGERSQTTGQAGGAAKLSTEQRTKITTVIRDQHVAPVTNVNFSISVGTRVPREVGFHPLPTEIVTIYPDWRGYEFFLVRDEIVVVDPRTLEIIAILNA
jgi:uncharacterized protein DUF1236